jgi:hypothetical protein
MLANNVALQLSSGSHQIHVVVSQADVDVGTAYQVTRKVTEARGIFDIVSVCPHSNS